MSEVESVCNLILTDAVAKLEEQQLTEASYIALQVNDMKLTN
jgi:hypothetical protein